METTASIKKQILSKLKGIEKAAAATGMQGKVSVELTGFNVDEWDAAIESINEYPRYNHFFEVSEKLTVTVLLG